MSSGPRLPLPEPPARVGLLGAPPDSLVYAAPATRRPFLAASPTVEVRGSELDGMARVVTHRGELLRSLRSGAGPCSNVLLGPRCVRRELAGRGGTVLETLLAADRRPGVVVQWITPSGGPLSLDVSWEAPGRPVAHRSAGPLLRVRPARGPDLLFCVLPSPVRWEIDAGSDGVGVAARVKSAGGPVTLLAATVDPADPGDAALASLARTGALEARAESAVAGVRRERLATRTGVPEIDDGLAWGVARTIGPGPSAPPLHPPRTSGRTEALTPLWMLVGALAAGDREGARAWIEAEPRNVADVLALGWWVRWTGDVAPLRRHRDTAMAALAGRDRGPRSPAGGRRQARPEDGTADLVHRAARQALADGLEALGEEGRPALHARRLPMVGGGGGPEPSRGGPSSDSVLRAVLAAILDGASSSPPDDAPPAADRRDPRATRPGAQLLRSHPGIRGAARALRAWALYRLGRPDEAYPLLRAHLAEGAAPPVGLWTSGRPAPDGDHDPVAAALTPAALLHGLLGAAAEAPWGRLRLAPAFPASWARFEVAGIRVGDARVALRYARDGGTHTFVVEQATGRVPLNLVFEPSIPDRVEAVRVDEAPTDLVPESRAGRTRVRLQLPLDAERSVTLVGSDP